MTKIDANMSVNFFAVSIIFLNIIFFSASESFPDTNTWNNIVERNDLFFKKFTNTPFNGKIETYWPNGNLKETGIITDGKKDNLWEYYYENGNPKEVEFFTNGLLNGIREQYGSGGQLNIRATYKDGKLDGPWIYIDPFDGWLYQKGQYKFGKKTGTWTFFTIFGEIEKTEMWQNGVKFFDSSNSESS